MHNLSINKSGFIGNIFTLKSQRIADLSPNISSSLTDCPSVKNITFDRKARLKYASNLFDCLSIEKDSSLIKYFTILSDQLECFNDFKLSELEIHFRWQGLEGIPPHQDMFYHACNGYSKFKILVACSPCNQKNGFLSYSLDYIDENMSLTHRASKTPGFSSFIPNFNTLKCSKIVSPDLQQGMTCAHFMNSIHWASFNKTSHPSIFLVFRYDNIFHREDSSKLRKYKAVWTEHVKNLQKLPF